MSGEGIVPDVKHPDFVKADPERQWGSRLEALYAHLMARAGDDRLSKEVLAADKGWEWRVIPSGIFCGMRSRRDVGPHTAGANVRRYELKLARLDPSIDPNRWRDDVADLFRVWRIHEQDVERPGVVVPFGSWLRLDPVESFDRGITVRRWLSLMAGEVTPGRAVCWSCWKDGAGELVSVEWNPSYGLVGQSCHPCAMERGRKAAFR